MTVHRHPCHHRPTVRGEKHWGVWLYRVRCGCGFSIIAAVWRTTLIAANTHSQELK